MKDIKELNSELLLDFSIEELEERLESVIVPNMSDPNCVACCYIPTCWLPKCCYSCGESGCPAFAGGGATTNSVPNVVVA